MSKNIKEVIRNFEKAVKEAELYLDNIDETFVELLEAFSAKENKTDLELDQLKYLQEEYGRITVAEHLKYLADYAKFAMGEGEE